MEPIHETRHAVEEYGPFIGDGDLLDQLTEASRRVRRLIPSCVGITLAVLRERMAFTLLATDREVAALDGVQYVDGGPCVTSAADAETVTYTAESATDEVRWASFARATAARGITSTLTLPILDEHSDEVLGSVNLYAADPTAFDGHHKDVAEVFGAWAAGAVSNADLDFSTRRAAEQTPAVLHDEVRINQAVGALIAGRQYDARQARDLILDAAERAGIEPAAIAALILEAWQDGDI